MPKIEACVFPNVMANVTADKFIWGGKGAGLIAMGEQGLNVPPGLIIPVSHSKAYNALPEGEREHFMDCVMIAIKPNLEWLKIKCGGVIPLLSVRSGAPVSMPGMMDTILNVGAIGDSKTEARWLAKLGGRTYGDCQRRLIEMLGTTAYNITSEAFAILRRHACELAGVESERDLNAEEMACLVSEYIKVWTELTGDSFPSFDAQLRAAIEAVFVSWNSERAIEYRKLNSIPDYGTAVTIQAMVFGNLNDKSGTGVLFSRNPSNGEGGIFGEYLINAQGEDVVAGTATPVNINEMGLGVGDSSVWEDIFFELEQICFKLEAHYRDMVDIEFTVQDGELFILQSRVGKRSALAAFVIAHDMVEGGLIKRAEAFKRLTREQVITIRLPSIDPSFKIAPMFKGIPACPGIVQGKVVHTSAQAVASDVPCILVREETSPDDIAGMAKAVGILTRTGGATSHAAVVARAMDKPCVVGATELDLSLHGDVTIDGSTGNVWFGVNVPVIPATDSEIIKTVMSWAAEAQGSKLRSHVAVEGEYVISIGERWFEASKVTELLSELASVDCSKIILDCRTPDWGRDFEDATFDMAFGIDAAKIPQASVRQLAIALHARRLQLKGLTLAYFPDLGSAADNAKVKNWGFGFCEVTKAVPAEYALFKAIQEI